MDQQFFQAAVMQLAPSKYLQCCSGPCCWRWAAQQLLAEYAAMRGAAEGLRAALDEELGHSVKQRFVDLKAEHDALLPKWRAASEGLSQLQERNRGLEREHVEAVAACNQANRAFAAAERAREELESKVAAQEFEFKAMLAASSSRPDEEELERLLEEEKENSAESGRVRDKATEDFLKVRIERTELEWKLQQMKVALLRKRWSKKRKAPIKRR